MPSSPPRSDRDEQEEEEPLDSPAPKSPTSDRAEARNGEVLNEEDMDEVRQREIDSPVLSRASTPDHAVRDLDARLAEYSIDFNRLAFDGQDDDLLPDMKPAEEDKLSDVGGPEDFTANLEKYLMGDDDDEERLERREIEEDQAVDDQLRQDLEEDQKRGKAQEQPENSKVQENDAELGEYSEFGPPVDMSTPSHLLHRTAGGLAKDVTHLENIEEGSDDELDTAATPSIRKQKTVPNGTEDKDEDLLLQIADLQQVLKDRDEQLQNDHKRVLEAASAGEQIKNLQAELQRKTTSLDKLHAQHNDDELLREKVQVLQRQNREKDLSLEKSAANAAHITTLQSQMADMRKALQNRNSRANQDTEQQENIAHFRQQLSSFQEQLRKRDATLDETIAKLREITTAKEQQLREKNTEIDGLRAQVDDQALEIEKLESDIEQANTDYQTLEGRITSLETKNRPLEEKNSTLEADLTRAQSQVTAQENALKAMAADPSTATQGQKTFTEILDLIKDFGPRSDDEQEPLIGSRNTREIEMERLRQEITRLQGEVNETSSARKTLEAELARSREHSTETQTLIKTIENENTRLTRRVDELRSTVDRAQRELAQLRANHSAALQTIERLQDERKTVQQPSPPPSPPTTQPHTTTTQPQPSTTATHLQSTSTFSPHNLQNLLAAAEKRESSLRAGLQALRTPQDTCFHTLTSEIQRLESVIAVKDETAAAMDARIAKSVEKREKEWERRVELLLKERDRMGRALMWTWGEKEVGDKECVFGEDGRKLRQGYWYKYANANAQGQKQKQKEKGSS